MKSGCGGLIEKSAITKKQNTHMNKEKRYLIACMAVYDIL